MTKLNIYPKSLDARQAERLIKQISADSDKILYTNHAQERMEQRDISLQDVERVLQNGFCVEMPKKNEKGEWKCKIVRHYKGNRDIGVISIILKANKLLIVTVEWEDL